jgi:hypothetical protein
MKVLWLTLAALVLSATSAVAQLVNITQLNVQTFAPGVSPITGTPLSDDIYLPTAFTCNVTAPAVPAKVVNPLRFFFDDPVNVGKVCLAPIVATLLAALPNLPGYVQTITVTDGTIGETSPRSAASNPFEIRTTPPAPTGFKVVWSCLKSGTRAALRGRWNVRRPKPWIRFETLR